MTDEDTPDEYEDEPALGSMLNIDGEDTDIENPDLGHKGVGAGFVVSGFVVASLLGGFIGIVIPKIFQHPGQAQQRETVIAKLDTLSQTANEQDKLIQNLKVRLNEQDSTIARLKKADEGLLRAQQEQQDSLAAYLEQSSTSKLPSNIGVGDQQNSNKPTEAATIITPDIAKPASRNKSADVTQTSLNILMDTFPREKMLAAVKAQEVLVQKKPGWLRRALRKHIKVRENVTPDPYIAIDAAETALKEGRVQAALDIIATLNPAVRASAADWVRAAKKAL